jgi:hypothetical protein
MSAGVDLDRIDGRVFLAMTEHARSACVRACNTGRGAYSTLFVPATVLVMRLLARHHHIAM